jgi:ABC-type phosphate/phosphonate transport system permease subunit
MKGVRSPLTSISLSLLGWPAGIVLGYLVVSRIGQFTEPLSANLAINLVSVIAAPLAFWYAFRWSMPQEETQIPGLGLRLARLAVLFLAIIIGFYALFQVAGLTANIGAALTKALGPIGFLGNFMFQVSEILMLITPMLGALAAGGALSNLLGRFGQRFAEKRAPVLVKIFNVLVAAAAGAVLFGLIGGTIEWLYQLGRPEYTFWGTAITGALLGAVLALFTKAKDTLPTGLIIYYVTRTILNTLRSVEALVMALVFVVAVGIGFQGAMALGCHDRQPRRRHSELLESISFPAGSGMQPATGCRPSPARSPQIVPPYISYTMYRWDINVRMSTIIGFVGGGGIGFLLQQNINLLHYRDASAQMLAIAVVVALMDYVSSVLREKTV